MAYSTSLRELTQTEDNETYLKTNNEQMQFEANQAYGTADHEQIQTECNQAYENKLITKQNEAYTSADHDRYCQMIMRQNKVYVQINPERESSALSTATVHVGQDGQVEHFYEQIPVSLNEDSASTQLQLGSQCERNDKTYDYILL